MRVFREEDPMDSGYTTISNDILWTDLSCRALGLLTRWLSKPPGVEVDTIQDITTRAKRRGNKRMEGRDALYTASYELEEEGFLVRRLFTNEKGQHEWAAFVRSRPVEPSERSNPAGRKRATVKTTVASKKTAKTPGRPARPHSPKPENPFSGPTSNDATSSQVSPVTEKPDSGEPDSDFQASSYQSSLHSSLSSDTASAVGDSDGDGEREEATQQDNGTAAAAAGGEASDANKVIDAYIAAYMATAGLPPRPDAVRQVRSAADALLSVGRSVGNLCTLASEMGAKGWTDLVRHAQMNPEAAAKRPVNRKPWCGECNGGREPLSAAARTWETEDGRVAKCHCHPGYVQPQPVSA